MNKQDNDELLKQGLTQKEIEDLTQKGFTKEEMIQAKEYDKEIKKGSNLIAWIVDMITWLIPYKSSALFFFYSSAYTNTYFDLPNS